jgi:prefoldin subunit 5
VAQVELHEGWKLQTAFRFRRRPIPKEKQLQYITPEVSAIQSEKTMVETVLRRVDIALTPVEELAKML